MQWSKSCRKLLRRRSTPFPFLPSFFLGCSISELFTVLRYLASSKGFPQGSHFMFFDELKSRMQIKFARLYRTQEPSLLSVPSSFCGFYISIEPRFLLYFSSLLFYVFSFDFKVFAILLVSFERDFDFHIYFISFVNDDVLCQLHPGDCQRVYECVMDLLG